MAELNAQQFAEDLADGVLLPLLVGGRLEPLPPIGEARAVALAEVPPSIVGDSESPIAEARLSVLRRLCPIDDLAEFDSSEWLILCALNDLLQATNPTLAGVFGQDNPRLLTEMAEAVLARVGNPPNIRRALMRHSLFSRVLEIERVDTEVSWWVGSRTFRGAEPPSRLVSWRSVRRVQTEETRVPLADLPPEQPWSDAWSRALRHLVAASPLTDLCHLGRRSPPFVITGGALGLLKTHAGRMLALRAIERAPSATEAPEVLRGAATQVAEHSQDAAGVVLQFADEIENRARVALEVSA